jgi:hypothetical protein
MGHRRAVLVVGSSDPRTQQVRWAWSPSKIHSMSDNVEATAEGSIDVLAAAPGTWPVGPVGVTIFFIVFVAVAIYMAIAYFKRRK